MSDEVKHECAVAMVVLRRPPFAIGDFGGTKLSLLLEKQHNRGQDGAGVAILASDPEPGEVPYWIAKSASASPLVDVLAAIGKRKRERTSDIGLQTLSVQGPKSEVERIFLGHLRYATFGKNEVAFCHPFVHEASDLAHTLLLAGNFNLTNAHELFEDYRRKGEFPTSRADGYLICELIAHELGREGHQTSDTRLQGNIEVGSRKSGVNVHPVVVALSKALADADGAWTLCGATGDGWAFATRDPHGIRPGWYYVSDDVVAVASERPAIQAAFDVPPEAVKELPPGQALIVSPAGEVQFKGLKAKGYKVKGASVAFKSAQRSCVFERIYFSRANDADIHRERKALGAALLPQILKSAEADLSDIFFSYIPNSARIAFHGLLEELFSWVSSRKEHKEHKGEERKLCNLCDLCGKNIPRFGEIAVKDAKFRTFIADASARREFYKHVYDVTYGLVRPGQDTLVVLDDSIVRGNTMKNAILPMLDRLGPKRIVVASSAPPIRYPDCYGIDMSTLDELVAFRALVNLLGDDAEADLSNCVATTSASSHDGEAPSLHQLYARFTDEQHCAEIARLLTPPDMKAEVKVVYQSIDALHAACPGSSGDWYFTGEYPTPGGYKVLDRALANYLKHKSERSY